MQKKSKPMQSKTQNNKWEEEVKRVIKLMDEGGLGKKRSIDGRLTYKLDEEDDNDIYVEDTLIRMVEKILSLQLEGVEKVDENTSDGYHTFKELYEHRITLFIALAKVYAETDFAEWSKECPNVWKSKLHSDGTSFDGWFILGIHKDKGRQITYHLPLEKWNETEFAETLEKAPEYDGHKSEDVLKRLKDLGN